MLGTLIWATVSMTFPPATKWMWRGHACNYVTAGQGPPLLLLHGFAGSAYNAWRETVPALAATHTVYGLDLLGLGESAQPSDVTYSIELWREQCEDFVREKLGDAEPPIVIGHSFGSLIALELAARSDAPVRAVGMMNCAIGMNNKNALKVADRVNAPGWQLGLFGAVLAAVDAIFNQKWLLRIILENFATAENVRGALAGSVYVNADRVSDDLVSDYLSLASDKEAAIEVLRQIYTNDGGPLPFDAAEKLPPTFPILAVWGDRDNLAPSSGPVGEFFRARAADPQLAGSTRFEEIAAGHVPQDDNAAETNRILREWLADVALESA